MKHGIILNPPRDMVVRHHDQIIVVAEDDDTYGPSLDQRPPAGPEGLQPQNELTKHAMRESILLCNWRRDIDDMLIMLDDAVKAGSEVHVMSDLTMDERSDVFHVEGFDESQLKKIRVVHHVGRPSVKRDLENVPLGVMDSVLILADERHEASPLESDAQNLATLLIIRDLRASLKDKSDGDGPPSPVSPLSPGDPPSPGPRGKLQRQESMMIRAEKQSIRNVLGMAQRSSLHRGGSGFESLGSQGSARSSLEDSQASWKGGELVVEDAAEIDDCSITCELLDTRTSAVAKVNSRIATQAEYVLSHGICAKILAMVAMRREVKAILDELLTDDGNSPMVFPISRLGGVGESPGVLSFAKISKIALDEHVLLLGYQKVAESTMIINPQAKDAETQWFSNDLLVGLYDTTKKTASGVYVHERELRKQRKQDMRARLDQLRRARVAGGAVVAASPSVAMRRRISDPTTTLQPPPSAIIAAPLRAGSGRLQPLGLQPSVAEIKEEHREEEEEDE